MIRTITAVSLAAAVLSAPIAFADSDAKKFDDRYYGGLQFSYVDVDAADRAALDDGLGTQGFLGRKFSKEFALELGISQHHFSTLGGAPFGPEQDEWAATLDLLYYPFKCCNVIQPFAKLGAGRVYVDNVSGGPAGVGGSGGFGKSWDPILKLGVGVDWKFDDHGTALRAEAGRRWSYYGAMRGDSTAREWNLSIGLNFPFGDAPELIDYCPDPAAPAAASPATDAEAPVETAAAPTDSDNDGVADSYDQCPATKAGDVVDTKGCAVNDVVDQERVVDTSPQTVVIYFGFDSDKLNGPARAALDHVAKNLVNRNFVVAISNGHADSTGTAEYNLSLSERRAAAVANYLVSQGVANDQVRQRAYGETRPAADNDSELGRAKNRRVEINLLRQ